MSETIPRWNLPDVNFVSADPEAIQAEMFAAYTAITGRTLAPGDPIRLFILAIADIIIQQRAAINYAGQQNLLSYARGEFLTPSAFIWPLNASRHPQPLRQFDSRFRRLSKKIISSRRALK